MYSAAAATPLFEKQSKAPATRWQIIKDFGTVLLAQPAPRAVPQTVDLPPLPILG